MTLTHRDLAALVAWLYVASATETEKTAESATLKVAIITDLAARGMTIEFLYMSNPDAMVVFTIIRVGIYLIVIYRGSYTGRDWVLDVLVRDIDPIGRPSIKRVHSGFYAGTVEASDIVTMFYRPGDKVLIGAHSLGASRGEIEGEHLVAVGIVPHLVVLWAPPAAFKPSTMHPPSYPIVAYRNVVDGDEDPVTYSTDIAGYRQRTPFTDLSAPPANPKWWDPFDLHHFSLYQSTTPATEIP